MDSHKLGQAIRVEAAVSRPADLPAAFRAIAADAREYTADERAAAIWERAADMVEESLRQSGLERLTLQQAALEGGYSMDHLRRLIDEGTIPDASGRRLEVGSGRSFLVPLSGSSKSRVT